MKTYGNVSWNDKPVLATSDDGRDVYVSWNGPTGGDPWVAQSHDRGATWTQQKLVDSKRYFFAFDGDVLHDGTVVFAQSDISYSGPGGAPEGVVKHHVFISRDGGATWDDRVLDIGNVGEACVAEGCSPTSTSATTRSRPTTGAISSSSTTARGPISVRSGSSPVAPSTGAERGAPASLSR